MRRVVMTCFAFVGLCVFSLSAQSDEPAPTPIPAPATSVRIPDLSGQWCGSWQSCTNGHNGPMRANFCKLCDGNYQVTFAGRFALLIPFRYKTTMSVTKVEDGKVYLSGSQYLGPIVGTFSYNAWATDCQFFSSFCSGKDQGTFTLSR